jgi:hypothetical protein
VLCADEFVRGEAAQGLEPFGVVVSQQKGLQVLVELRGGLVMVAQHGGLLQGAVPALDLAVGPRMRRFGEAVFDAVRVADAPEEVAAGVGLVGHGAEVRAVVGQHRVHPVGQRGQHPAQQLGGQHLRGPGLPVGEGPLAGAVDGHKQVHAARLGVHFGQVHVQVGDGVVLEFVLGRAFSVFGQRQATPAVTLEQAVQRRAGQAWNRGLPGVEAIIQRQLRVLAEGHRHGFCFRPEHRRGRRGTPWGVLDRGALAPLGHGFGGDAVAPGYALYAFRTTRDSGPHCRRGAGAAGEYLSHKLVRKLASKDTPPHSGTIHLARDYERLALTRQPFHFLAFGILLLAKGVFRATSP